MLCLLIFHSFDNSQLDPTIKTDLWIAHHVQEKIREFSQGRIEPASVHDDPELGSISERINRELNSSDAALCLFTRRDEKKFGGFSLETEEDFYGRKAFLFAHFLRCTGHERDTFPAILEKPLLAHDGHDLGFDLHFKGLKPEKGAQVEYELCWGYPDAFLPLGDLKDALFNSVGLRSGRRRFIREVVLELQFQRNRQGTEELPIFDEPPRLDFNYASICPRDQNPLAFWTQGGGWQPPEHGDAGLEKRPDLSDGSFETYWWSQTNFTGHARASWIPSANYHVLKAEDQVAVDTVPIKSGRSKVK